MRCLAPSRHIQAPFFGIYRSQNFFIKYRVKPLLLLQIEEKLPIKLFLIKITNSEDILTSEKR